LFVVYTFKIDDTTFFKYVLPLPSSRYSEDSSINNSKVNASLIFLYSEDQSTEDISICVRYFTFSTIQDNSSTSFIAISNSLSVFCHSNLSILSEKSVNKFVFASVSNSSGAFISSSFGKNFSLIILYLKLRGFQINASIQVQSTFLLEGIVVTNNIDLPI
jgi:hypothetical protein